MRVRTMRTESADYADRECGLCGQSVRTMRTLRMCTACHQRNDAEYDMYRTRHRFCNNYYIINVLIFVVVEVKLTTIGRAAGLAASISIHTIKTGGC